MRALVSSTILLLTLSTVAFKAHSQADVEPYQEYGKRVKAAQQVSPLSSELFGESVSLYNGKTEFRVTDIDLPGNNSLPVQAGRRYVVESRKQMGYLGGFGVWDVEVPYIHGIFQTSVGWVTSPAGRCSSGMPPNTSSAWFQHDEIWSGTNMYIPGQGDRELLRNTIPNTVQVSDGNTYPWTTSGDFRIRCLASTANGYAGQGFLALGPDGTKYFFNHGIEAAAPRIGTQISGTNVPRKRIFLLATRVEDRFGNYVTYAYTGSKLTSITASDGRQLTFAYGLGNGLVTSVTTDGGRVWTYQYTNGQLVSVTLPDSSRWTYATPGAEGYGFIPFYEPPMPNESGEALCLEPGLPSGAFQLLIGHPSGATGQFDFAILRHYRDGTPAACGQRAPGDDYLFVTNYFDNYSLGTKTITGPGLTGQTWTYNYEGYSDDFVAAPGSCIGCDDWKLVTVNEPRSQKKTYKFGITYGVNEGRLLTESVVDSSGTTRKTVQNTYMTNAVAATQPFPDKYGESWIANFDSTSNKIRPVVLRQITQDGATFSSQTNSFEVFARPASVTKASSGMSTNLSRTDVTLYHNNLSQWVVGQVAKVTCVAPSTPLPAGCGSGTVMSETTFDPSSALPLTSSKFGKLQRTLTYYADGILATVKDGNNNVTTLSNWYRGIPRTIQYPATPEAPSGATRTAVVDNSGWITAVTDENGFSTSYGYDAMGRMASIVYPTGDSTAWNTVTMAFQQINANEHGLPAGHWRASRYEGNKHINTYYDGLWRPVLEEQLDYANIAGTLSQTVKRYDLGGRLAFQSYPTTNVGDFNSITQGVRTSYDALDRVTRVEQDSELGVLASTTEYQAGFKTLAVNPRGYRTLTLYAAYDQPTYDWPVTINQADSTADNASTDIVRDVFGKPTAVRRRNADGSLGVWRYYVYQADQQLCKVIEPEAGATIYGYDGASNLIQSASGLQGYGDLNSCNHPQAWASGRVVNRTYDARNRLKTLAFPDGNGNQSWDYTPDGLPSLVTTTQANVVPTANTYSYNKRRLLTNEVTNVAGAPLSLGYTYDSNGSLSVLTYPNTLTVNYAPNALGQATQAGSYVTGVQYYPNGAVKQFTYGNGITHQMTQNARQLPATSADSGAIALEYVYDANSNVQYIYDWVSPAFHRYLYYDGLDRLTSAGSQVFGGDHWHRFTYDALDNLKSWKLAGVKDYAEYVYDAKNQLTNIKNSAGATVVGIGYDAQGNVSNKNGANFGFDYGNRLRGSDTEWYAYDAHGRRILSCNATACDYQQYAFDGKPYFHLDYRKGKRYNNIYLAGSVVAIREAGVNDESNPQLKYQHTDALGSPVTVTDTAGTVIDRTNYEPYGAAINKPAYDGIGYTGHVMDGATGLTYMQQRYYDPTVGRFLSADPVQSDPGTGANFNRYWYANNNPYKFTDPDGRFGLQIVGGVIGAVISGGSSYLKGNDVRTVLKDAAIGGIVGVVSTIPGGGALAVGLRAGLASGAGDAVSQAYDKGITNVDLKQSLGEGIIAGVTAGVLKGSVDKLIPNRNMPGLPDHHPLVREGRAVAQKGSEFVTAPIRDKTELAAGSVISAGVATANVLDSKREPPPPEPKK